MRNRLRALMVLGLVAPLLLAFGFFDGLPPASRVTVGDLGTPVLQTAGPGLLVPTASASTVGYWENVTRAPGPETVPGSAMAYVPEIGASLSFGGSVQTASNDSWAYNSSLRTWTRLPLAPPVPPGRWGAAMVYDPDVGKVVLFGGLSNFSYDICSRDDTWLFDPGTNAWQNVTPPVSPPSRFFHAMTYDPLTHEVVLFGGLRVACGVGGIPEDIGQEMNDTWVYDARTNTWDNVTAASAPPARFEAGMAYYPLLQSVVLFGGAKAAFPEAGILGDTWLLDPASYSWRELAPFGSPPPQYGAGVAYDAAARAVVLYGGCTGGPSFACYRDTWWYTDAVYGWRRMPSLEAPPSPPRQAFVYEPGGVILAFGGSEAWEYHVAEVDPLSVTVLLHIAPAGDCLRIVFESQVSGGAGIAAFAWSFGDGGTSSLAVPIHTYCELRGTSVTLTVTDTAGNSAQAFLSLFFGTAPAPPPPAAMDLTGVLVLAVGVSVATIAGVWWWHRRRDSRSR